jgi:hypothetical protein
LGFYRRMQMSWLSTGFGAASNGLHLPPPPLRRDQVLDPVRPGTALPRLYDLGPPHIWREGRGERDIPSSISPAALVAGI